MKLLLRSLAFSFTILFLIVVTAQPVAALGGWVDHKFMLGRPDGTISEVDLKGAKMHIYHKSVDPDSTYFKGSVNSFCVYPDKNNEFGKYVDEDRNPGDVPFSGGYHCLTPQSCSNIDYGAPYLPKSFNSSESVYNDWEDASYKTFHSNTFTEALASSSLKDIIGSYQPDNIRGFDKAIWTMKLDSNPHNEVGLASQQEIDTTLNSRSDWGNIKNYGGDPKRWSQGEVYRDSAGDNALHAAITWVLVPPKTIAPAVKPTATLVGKCTNTTPGTPSFTYTFSNIDLKGQQFSYARLFIRLPHDASEAAIKAALGEPFFTNAGSYGYNIKFFDAAPTSFEINANTPILGKDNVSKVTLGQFITNSRASLHSKYTFDVAGVLESKSGETKTLNDYVKATFQPKFINNECGQAPTALQCLDIKILDFGGNPANIATLQPNQKIKFQCGQVAGVTQYKFKVLELNSAGQIGKTVDMQQYPGRLSVDYSIPQAGKFIAQCAICPNGVCQEFEPASYVAR